MSSKRGRKRNDNLPPNRARDVQRAFRARRAAHLQALEQRVAELEDENNCLRQALNLPPSARPPLGKGPTGKDKPKPYESTTASGSSSQPLSFTSTSRESSTVGSPVSRTGSLSPSTINVSMSSRPMQLIESGSSWNNDLLLSDGHQSDVSGPTTSSYQLTPMTAPLPLKPVYPSYGSGSLASSSRDSVSSNMYISNSSTYSHTSDRPASQNYSGLSFNLRNADIREEPPRQYSYTPSPFQAYNHADMHSQSPSPGIPAMHPQNHQQHHRDSPVSYPPPHRRSADPQGFSLGQGVNHLPYPSQTHGHSSNLQPPTRQTQVVRGQEGVMHPTPPPRSHTYGSDGRLNHHPMS